MMFKHAHFLVFGLVFLGIAGLCAVFLIASPAWAQDCGLVCDPTTHTCDQAQSGSCPGCVLATFGNTCAAQGLTTRGSGNQWFGAMNNNGTYITWVPMCCVEAANCNATATYNNSTCSFFGYCTSDDLDSCQNCAVSDFSPYSYVQTCVNCGKCQQS